MSDYSSIVPVGCRKTSGFGNRWGSTHAGTDYAPPKPGQTGVPIFAVRAGTVSKVGLGNGKNNAAVLPFHSGNGILIDHGKISGRGSTDNVESYYGHLASYSVRVGQRVVAGEKIGVMGNTGISSNVHLHFGIRLNKRKMIDSDSWIRSKEIVVGKTAPVKPTVQKPSTPSNSTQDNKNIQAALKAMGFYKGVVDGVNGTMQKDAVKAYQRSQRVFKLVADGVWGKTTQAHYVWAKKLQSTLNNDRWSGKNPKLAVDGNLMDATVNRIKYVQKTYRKYYSGAVDGVPGKMFCAAIGIPTHP